MSQITCQNIHENQLQIFFGDCLPLSLALHHLPTTINRATTTPISSHLRAIFSSSISVSSKTTGLTSPSRHHRVFRRHSVAVTPSITLALASSIACRRHAVCRRRTAAAATPPPSCRQPRAVALPPPPLPPSPRRRSLVGCCIVVRRPTAFADKLASTASTAATAATATAAGPPQPPRKKKARTN